MTSTTSTTAGIPSPTIAESPHKTGSSQLLTDPEIHGIAGAVGGTSFILIVIFGWWGFWGRKRRAEKKKREAEAATGINAGTVSYSGRRDSSPQVKLPERMRQ
ncbi:hypothetical protein QBC37DRAFT_483669 [Rhypophila decipiens]|uniref:Uncharacterized protein n=1 Tax=Rhypophila decipiens TaxID=261697 RepID=A0AAN6Y4R7_9PEZI|nr:hypothetical protein QBC37DRAFT_483669 [Rhypophila decipiens]